MVTVDVEAQPVRAAEHHIERLIFGRFGYGPEFGIGRMFDIAERHNCRLTCYLDYAEEYLYGDQILQVGRYIKSRNHDLQVHLHPDLIPRAIFEKEGVAYVADMFNVGHAQAHLLFNFAVDAHRRTTGCDPLAFRGGGYRYNREVLRELASHDFRFDSSYNPSRKNQPFNIGASKQFRWDCGVVELPISCVPNFKNTGRLFDYNFNADVLMSGSVDECVAKHDQYLQEFFSLHGEDAIAVLVMHSWSFLVINDNGHYDNPNSVVVSKFEALIKLLSERYLVVTTENLANTDDGSLSDHIVISKYIKNTAVPSVSDPLTLGSQTQCDVCGAAVEAFKDFNGPKRKCGVCGSLERQRTFASLMKRDKSLLDIKNSKVLLISPSVSEKRLFSALEGLELTTLDVRAEIKPDVVADVCDMSKLADGSFNIVFACHVLSHVHDLKTALSEISRVLWDGGVFINHEPSSQGALTRELTDIKEISAHYGLEAYEKYKVGRFRNFGELDIESRFMPFFKRTKRELIDPITDAKVIWNFWRKPVGRSIEPSSITCNLAVSDCPVCHDPLTEVESGQNCKGCGSRARLRSMAPLMREYLAPRMRDNRAVELPLLAFAMTGAERKFLSTIFKSIKSVSLFGNYSTDHESGVDMRDLSRYPPDGFSGVFGCLLFDYFPEHEQALRECYRVIAPGGVFFTHIAPYRLVDGDMSPQQKGAIKSRAGYFEYLPDKTELPDVKVGREWFLSAMERVGFKTALVRVRDAVPSLVSEWFIGIKPGAEATTKEKSLPVSNPSASAPSNIDTRVSEVFRSIVPLGTAGQGVLKFELIEAQRGSLVFLEDCYLPALDGGGSIREVVATNGSRNQILVSRDLGKNWQPLYENVKWDDKIRWAFSLADGSRLIRTFSGRMYHLGAGGELVSEYSTGAWHWHGSQGIGQSNRGTVMYAEYAPLRDADGVQDLSVWRYRPWAPQDGWHRVLTLPAAVRPPQGELRHFHVCRPHPSAPSLWILASGDIGAHCRMWLSQDDGDHWQEVMLDQAELVGMPEGKYPRLLRFTQFAALDNGDLIWGTDDTSDVNRAALISLSLSTNRPVFRFLGWLGRNCIRNIASLGGDRYLLLSESTHDPVSADCILYNATTERVTPFLLPNLGQIQNPVTDSLGSLQMPNGVGFFPAQGAVLMHPDKRGIFRVSIEDLSQ